MKFEVGDKVKANNGDHCGEIGTIKDITPGDPPYLVQFPSGARWKCEDFLEFVPETQPPQGIEDVTPIRAFETGATRDTAAGKLSYMKALSPEVLEAYVTYLSKHRKQSDGSMREFDNWKLGIDKWTYLDSLLRHDKDVWKHMLGYKVSDNHGPVTFLDSLMGTIFNAMGLAYEVLIEEGKAIRQGVKNETK